MVFSAERLGDCKHFVETNVFLHILNFLAVKEPMRMLKNLSNKILRMEPHLVLIHKSE